MSAWMIKEEKQLVYEQKIEYLKLWRLEERTFFRCESIEVFKMFKRLIHVEFDFSF